MLKIKLNIFTSIFFEPGKSNLRNQILSKKSYNFFYFFIIIFAKKRKKKPEKTASKKNNLVNSLFKTFSPGFVTLGQQHVKYSGRTQPFRTIYILKKVHFIFDNNVNCAKLQPFSSSYTLSNVSKSCQILKAVYLSFML